MSLFSIFFGARAQEDNVIKVISSADFESCIDHPEVQLVDVRTPKEFNGGFIGKAVNLDFYKQQELIEGLEKLDKDKPVYVYCQAGGRSNKAAKIMKKMGFTEIYDLKGGYSGYSK